MTRIVRILAVIMITLVLFSGCFLFRKKNKCGDCPKWGKAPVERIQARQS